MIDELHVFSFIAMLTFCNIYHGDRKAIMELVHTPKDMILAGQKRRTILGANILLLYDVE